MKKVQAVSYFEPVTRVVYIETRTHLWHESEALSANPLQDDWSRVDALPMFTQWMRCVEGVSDALITPYGAQFQIGAMFDPTKIQEIGRRFMQDAFNCPPFTIKYENRELSIYVSPKLNEDEGFGNKYGDDPARLQGRGKALHAAFTQAGLTSAFFHGDKATATFTQVAGKPLYMRAGGVVNNLRTEMLKVSPQQFELEWCDAPLL